MIIRLIAGLIKMILLYKMSYYPEPDSHGKNKMKGELYLSDYAVKSEVEKPTVVDTS